MSKRPIPLHPTAVTVYPLRFNTEGDAEYLLLRRAEEPYIGVWAGVCGGIEAGETAWQAALRELKEESGHTTEALYSADDMEFFYEWSSDRVYMFPIFVAMIDPMQPTRLSIEHDGAQWGSLDKTMRTICFEQQRESLKRIHRMFVENPPNPRLRVGIPSA